MMVSAAEIKDILSTPPDSRLPNQLTKLQAHFSQFDIFAKLKIDHTTQMLIMKHLTYVEFSQGQKMFDYGDRGDMYYVVLQG